MRRGSYGVITLKNDSDSTPVLIIGFSRCASIRMQIEKLISYGLSDIYLSLDYSTSPLVQRDQLDLIHYCNQKSRNTSTSIQIWQRKRNHGVGVGILSALEWFFSQNESGIVIEDDLIFDENFVKFCKISLEKFRSCEEILMISGNRYDGQANVSEVVGTNYPQIWGWASWRSKWKEIYRLILRDSNFNLMQLNHPNKCFFYSGALRARLGFLDTWDLPLAYEMLTQARICILPPVNLVSNIGTDQYAVHTRQSAFPLNFPTEKMDNLVLPSLERIKASCEKQNIFLEKNVFRVKRRHHFSPFKLWVSLIYYKCLGREVHTLKARLEAAEKLES